MSPQFMNIYVNILLTHHWCQDLSRFLKPVIAVSFISIELVVFLKKLPVKP